EHVAQHADGSGKPTTIARSTRAVGTRGPAWGHHRFSRLHGAILSGRWARGPRTLPACVSPALTTQYYRAFPCALCPVLVLLSYFYQRCARCYHQYVSRISDGQRGRAA